MYNKFSELVDAGIAPTRYTFHETKPNETPDILVRTVNNIWSLLYDCHMKKQGDFYILSGSIVSTNPNKLLCDSGYATNVNIQDAIRRSGIIKFPPQVKYPQWPCSLVELMSFFKYDWRIDCVNGNNVIVFYKSDDANPFGVISSGDVSVSSL